MAYDAARHRVLMFGGHPGNLSDLWELDLTPPMAWKPIHTAGPAPSGRHGHSAVYDPVRDRLLIFGGLNTDCLNDVWALNLSGTPTWIQLNPDGVPPPIRQGPCAAYDPVRDRLIILTGSCGGGGYNDVWALTLSGQPAWAQLLPTGNPPDARTWACAAYDSSADRIVLFAGSNPSGVFSDLWSLSLADPPAWSPLSASGTPAPGGQSNVGVMDTKRNRFVVYNGSTDSPKNIVPLQLGPEPAWLTVSTPPGPDYRVGAAGIYDPVSDGVIVFGGEGRDFGLGLNGVYDQDVWEWSCDDSAWTRLKPTGTPEQPLLRADFATALDPVRNQLFVVGGYIGYGVSLIDDTWRLDLGIPTWNRVGTTQPLSPRQGHSAIVDEANDRMIVFGGTGYAGDLMQLPLSSPDSWSALTPASSPMGAVADVSMAYDPIRRQMLVYGGAPGPGWSVYALSLQPPVQWTKVYDGSHGPTSGIWEGGGAFDVAADQLLAVGGYGRAEIWALRNLSTTPAWTQLAPASGPPVRSEPAISFDPVHRRLWVVGGWGPGYYLDDVWEFDVAPTPSWRQLFPAGTSPLPRGYQSVNYDAVHDRLVLFGGHNGAYLADTWFLQFDQPTPVLASLVSATATDREADVVWNVSTARTTPVDIERTSAGSGWRTIGAGTPDGRGYVHLHDVGLGPNMRYGYRLAWTESGSRMSMAEAWVQMSVPAHLELTGVFPNPASLKSVIRFSLPDAAPARLDIVDVSGRRVESRELSGLGAGSHALQTSESRLTPGLYFATLRHGSETRTIRFVVTD